jgi:hypothetical protein
MKNIFSVHIYRIQRVCVFYFMHILFIRHNNLSSFEKKERKT